MQIRARVGILLLNVLQKLIDSNMWRNILSVWPKNVEELLIDGMLLFGMIKIGIFWVLILTCAWIVKSWATILLGMCRQLRHMGRLLIVIIV